LTKEPASIVNIIGPNAGEVELYNEILSRFDFPVSDVLINI